MRHIATKDFPVASNPACRFCVSKDTRCATLPNPIWYPRDASKKSRCPVKGCKSIVHETSKALMNHMLVEHVQCSSFVETEVSKSHLAYRVRKEILNRWASSSSGPHHQS